MVSRSAPAFQVEMDEAVKLAVVAEIAGDDDDDADEDIEGDNENVN